MAKKTLKESFSEAEDIESVDTWANEGGAPGREKKEKRERHELLIGCGSKSAKTLMLPDHQEWSGLVRLDINNMHKPDVVWDLEKKPWPFEDNTFDEVHAYEVMEHLGRQGDYRSFFADFTEIWRVLKSGGHFFGTSPEKNSPWAWGDPGHTRIIGPECLVFLVQPEYDKQVGITPMTDYRWLYQADFEVIHSAVKESSFHYGLMAIKPSRYAPKA